MDNLCGGVHYLGFVVHLLVDRYLHGEDRAMSDLAGHLDSAPMEGYEFFGQGETYPIGVIPRVVLIVIELGEYMPDVVLGNPDPFVLDPEHEQSAALFAVEAQGDIYLFVFGSVFDRVRKEVEQHLVEFVDVEVTPYAVLRSVRYLFCGPESGNSSSPHRPPETICRTCSLGAAFLRSPSSGSQVSVATVA